MLAGVGTKSNATANVAEGSARGPGGIYRLACTDRGLVLCELPAKKRGIGAFRDRLERILQRPRVADEGGGRGPPADPLEHLEQFCDWVAHWDGETAWEVFWHPPSLDLRGSLFRRKVWTALRTLPPGEVLTYRELAERSGSPRAARAVGSSMHENPAALFVPCHRVVSAAGLGGFGSAGLDLKKQLLRYESVEL